MKVFNILARVVDRGDPDERFSKIKVTYTGLGKEGRVIPVTYEWTMDKDITLPKKGGTYYLSYTAKTLDDRPAQWGHVIKATVADTRMGDIEDSYTSIDGTAQDVTIVTDKNNGSLLGYFFNIDGHGIRLWINDLPEEQRTNVVEYFKRTRIDLDLTVLPLEQNIYDQFGQPTTKLKYGVFRVISVRIPEDEDLFDEMEDTESPTFDEDKPLPDGGDETSLPNMSETQSFQYRISVLEYLKDMIVSQYISAEMKEILIDEFLNFVFRFEK